MDISAKLDRFSYIYIFSYITYIYIGYAHTVLFLLQAVQPQRHGKAQQSINETDSDKASVLCIQDHSSAVTEPAVLQIHPSAFKSSFSFMTAAVGRCL